MYKGSIDIANNFNVTVTRPLDVRTVVDSEENLINGSIKAPYKGMVVGIAGTSKMYMYLADGVRGANTLNDENISDKFGSWVKVSSVEVVDGEINASHFTVSNKSELDLKPYDEAYELTR